MKRIISLIAVVLISTIVFGQENQQPNLPKQASEVASEEIEWVWKKDFQEEIKNIVVEEKQERKKQITDNKEILIEEIKPVPRVVVTKDFINFFSVSGKSVTKKIRSKLEKLFISKNKKYIGINAGYPFGDPGYKKPWFEMMDIDGFTLWETTNVYSSFIRPSPNGKYAVGFVRESDRVETGLYVYEEQKNNPLKIDIFSLKRIKDAQFDFSNDGKVWAALVDVIFQLAEKRYYAVSLLYFLDVNKLLWKISPESYIRDMGEDNIELYGWEIAVSKTGKFVSILIMRKIENTEKRDVTIYTYDNKGKLLWKHLLRESDYKFAFSDSERHIYAAGVQSKQIYCFDSLSGKLEWEVDGTEIDGYEISALLVSKNNATIAVVLSSHPNLTLSDERRKLYDEFIHVFDNYGKKIKTWKFSRGTILHRDEDYTPCVEISDNGKKVFVATKEGIISCNIHRAEIKE